MMNFIIVLNFIIASVNPITHNWVLSEASLTSCSDGPGEMFFNGIDQNCVDTEYGRYCHVVYMSFQDDGSCTMRVETRHVESDEQYTSYNFDGRYSVGIDGGLTICNTEMVSCEEVTYQIDRDKLLLNGVWGCDGTMTFERVREDRH